MTVLCYHALDAGWDDPVAVTPDAFASQCRWLAGHRRVVRLEDAVGRLRHGRLPAGEVAITFDDGFASVYEHALPVLARHRLPATVFLVAGTLLPRGVTVDWLRPPPPTPPATLTRDQITEMAAEGITFGSHSMRHDDLTTLSEAECEVDLRQSRIVLEDVLGRPVPLLAYPFGGHNEVVRRAARRAGHTAAFSLPGQPEPRTVMSIPRVGIYRRNGAADFWLKNQRGYLSARTSRAALLAHRAAALVR